MPSILVVVEPAFLSAETLRAAAVLARRLRFPLVVARLPSGKRPDRPEVTVALEELVRTFREQGVEVRESRLEGDAEKALLACVRESVAWMVVFADDPGSTRIEDLTGAILRTTPTALALVRDPGPLVRWAEGGATLRTMLAMDFSSPSEAALAWVRSLQTLGPLELTVAHVSWLPGQRRRLGITAPMEPDAEAGEIRRVLEREMQEFVGPAEGVRFLVRLSLGRTADAIAFTASEEGAELVVVGTKQRQGLSRLWHGSVAGGVLAEARTNVVCVPVTRELLPALEARPLAPLDLVLAATDFSEAGDRAVHAAFSLLPKGGTVHLVHVVDPSDPPAREGEALQHLWGLVPPAAAERGVKAVPEILRARNAAEALSGRAERLGADVLVVGYHGHTAMGWGSVAEGVLRLAGRPVLVVKAPEGGDLH